MYSTNFGLYNFANVYLCMQDLNMSVFYEELMSKAQELFPHLETSELTSFLLNSRAISAYDAVALIVHNLVSSSQASEPLDPCLIVSTKT